MKKKRYIEVSNSEYDFTNHTAEKLQEMCTDEESAIETHFNTIDITKKFLKLTGNNTDTLSVITNFTVFYDKDDINTENGEIIDDAKPLDDLVAVNFTVADDTFGSNEAVKNFYYEYVMAINKKHYVSYSKFMNLLELVSLSEIPHSNTEQIGKDILSADDGGKIKTKVSIFRPESQKIYEYIKKSYNFNSKSND